MFLSFHLNIFYGLNNEKKDQTQVFQQLLSSPYTYNMIYIIIT